MSTPARSKTPAAQSAPSSNFIRAAIEADLASRKYAARGWGGAPGPASTHEGGRARDDSLSDLQRAALAAEGKLSPPYPTLDQLLAGWRSGVETALGQLAATPEAVLKDARQVGRAKLPSTVLGLLFHASEHAQRHAGQIVTTAKIVQGLQLGSALRREPVTG